MTLMQKVTRGTVKYVRHVKRQRVIARLAGRNDNASQQLAQALRNTVEGRVTPEERAWIKRIEDVRTLASTSKQPIEIMDFGAGAPEDAPSTEEMERGNVIHTTVGSISGSVGKRKQWALLLMQLVRTFKPKACVELGTNMGFSAAYQGAALKLNQQGKFISLEGAPEIATCARQHLHSLGLDDIVSVVTGRFQDTLGGVLEQHKPIDYVFIDGHHDEQATIAYFRQIKPFLAPKALLVFDDIHWTPGMTRAWESISAAPEIGISLDLHAVGICIIDKAIQDKAALNISLYQIKQQVQ